MKRIFCVILMLILMCGCTAEKNISDVTQEPEGNEISVSDSEFKGVWLPIYEIAPEKNTSAERYADRVTVMLERIADFGFTDIFVQVRANCDSIYPSAYFSPAKQFSDESELVFDAIEIFVEGAHRHKLKIHAWLNPYRVSSNGNYDGSSIAFNYISRKDVSCGDSYSYIKPSSASGRRLILEGVRELLEKYELDGIHIDDYFYPTTDKGFDSNDYDRYISQGGLLSLDEWRRENVNILISSMYSLIKNHNDRLIFSISPCGDIDKNFSKLYADVEMWCRCPGFADIIIPQIYYGFENSSQPFEKCLSEWSELEKAEGVRLIPGLAAYKTGKEDKYAGKGKNEWKENDDILKRQIELIRNNSLDGFAVFSYNYIFGNSYFKNNEIISLNEMI